MLKTLEDQEEALSFLSFHPAAISGSPRTYLQEPLPALIKRFPYTEMGLDDKSEEWRNDSAGLITQV